MLSVSSIHNTTNRPCSAHEPTSSIWSHLPPSLPSFRPSSQPPSLPSSLPPSLPPSLHPSLSSLLHSFHYLSDSINQQLNWWCTISRLIDQSINSKLIYLESFNNLLGSAGIALSFIHPTPPPPPPRGGFSFDDSDGGTASSLSLIEGKGRPFGRDGGVAWVPVLPLLSRPNASPSPLICLRNGLFN